MARKIFISILGTGYYEPTKYFFDKISENVIKTRFIQETTIKKFCCDWVEKDKIFIFLTESARTTNWESPAQKENKKESYPGLNEVLKEIELKAKITDIDIPDGKNEKEIWEIFQIIFNQLEENDKVYFDITHGFRSLPMLLMVLINYSKFLKNIVVKSITYGNHQDEKDGYSPIINLTAFSQLQDWTSAADEFINNGCSYQLDKIIRKEAEQKAGAEKQNLQKFTKELSNLLLSFSTVRGKEIYSGNIFKNLNNEIDKLIEINTLNPLSPIIEEVKNKIKDYSTEYNIENGSKAIEWCVEHKLTQQAFTLGQEHIISVLCDNFSLDYTKKEHREIVSSTLGIINKKNDISKNKLSKVLKDNYKLFEDLKKNQVFKDLAKDYGELSRFRNSINHAGMIGDIQAISFEKNFNKFYSKIIDTLKKHKIIL